MKRLSLETLVPDNFKFAARDMDGKVFAFENKPNIATDIACDTWDVKEGEILQLTNPVYLSAEGITFTEIGSELGDWRESLMELNNENVA
jgi:hypothetical protein|tara:strand:- start:823 stop:1092 length:270 start_codon:yes stop_codon:yes gene_type:complete